MIRKEEKSIVFETKNDPEIQSHKGFITNTQGYINFGEFLFQHLSKIQCIDILALT